MLLIYRLSIVTVTYNNSNTVDKEHVFKDVENKEYTYHKNNGKQVKNDKMKLDKKRTLHPNKKTAKSKKKCTKHEQNLS